MTNVMVVEDEPLIATDLAETLSSTGYEVTGTVASAAACMDAADKRRPDLVLMDINLGGDVDGIDAARCCASASTFLSCSSAATSTTGR